MPTNNDWDNQIAAANSPITLNSGTHGVNISTDAAATVVNVATGSGNKTLNLGSTNTTSTTNFQSGSGGINIPAFTEGALVTSSAGRVSSVDGTMGYVLTANAAGTAPSFQPIGSGSSTLIWDRTVAGVNNLDSGVIPGGFAYYYLEALNYWFTVNDNMILRVFFGDGVTFSGKTYKIFQQANESTGSPGAVIRALGTSGIDVGELLNGFQGTTDHNQLAPGYGKMFLYGMMSASTVKQMVFAGADRSNDAVSTEQLLGVGSTTTAFLSTDFRISAIAAGSTFPFSGRFRLFGVI